MISKDDFINSDHRIAICGLFYTGDTIHVGIAWKYENEKKVLHFQSGNNIPLADLEDAEFDNYFFNPILDFNIELLPSFSIMANRVSNNRLNSFLFNRVGVVYNGGKFLFNTGDFETATFVERIVNCGVFTVGFLKSYDYTLLDWNSWPNTQNVIYSAAIHVWCERHGIPDAERQYYLNSAKEIRGKHVIVCPSTTTKPSPYLEVMPLSDQLIYDLNNP